MVVISWDSARGLSELLLGDAKNWIRDFCWQNMSAFLLCIWFPTWWPKFGIMNIVQMNFILVFYNQLVIPHSVNWKCWLQLTSKHLQQVICSAWTWTDVFIETCTNSPSSFTYAFIMCILICIGTCCSQLNNWNTYNMGIDSLIRLTGFRWIFCFSSCKRSTQNNISIMLLIL